MPDWVEPVVRYILEDGLPGTLYVSAIAVVGSILIAGEQRTTFSTILGTIAVAASVTNIVSGFLITDRMLKMFREREPKA